MLSAGDSEQLFGNAVDIPSFSVAEAKGFVVRVETDQKTLLTGKLVLYDMSSGNVQLENVLCRASDSSLSIIERMVVKGSNVRMIVLPRELRNAPFLDWTNQTTQKALNATFKNPTRKRTSPSPAANEQKRVESSKAKPAKDASKKKQAKKSVEEMKQARKRQKFG